jgi:hypothetical protein
MNRKKIKEFIRNINSVVLIAPSLRHSTPSQRTAGPVEALSGRLLAKQALCNGPFGSVERVGCYLHNLEKKESLRS